MTKKNNKYELLSNEFIEVMGTKLFRIRAKCSFGIIEKRERGGYIEAEKNLGIAGNAWVFGDARVFDDAKVFGNASVFGNTRIFGNARVSDDASVFGNASVSGNTWVFGNASVFGDARIFGNARVFGYAGVSGDARISGNASVSGNAKVSGYANVFGDAKVFNTSDLIVIGPIGSRDDYISIIISSGQVKIGCFVGSLDELEAAATKEERQDYIDLLPGIRAIVARRQAKAE